MENMGNYYNFKYNTDFRSIRLPGIVSPYEIDYQGTTDYASEIFFYALRGRDYQIPLNPNRLLPFVYLNDIVDGIVSLLQADRNILSSRVYNIQALSFTPEDLTNEIKKHISNIRFSYDPDYREDIAKNWPESLSDDLAKNDWKWNPKFTKLSPLVIDMINTVKINRI
jgi:threonine 3-dehydrogenase